MSKIVQAVNSMIAFKEQIGNVFENQHTEFFFTYKEKTRWSIRSDSEEVTLFLYPHTDMDTKYLASLDGSDFGDIPYVLYKDSEIGTREAKQSFAELYTIVKGKLLGVDDILDQIIDDLPF